MKFRQLTDHGTGLRPSLVLNIILVVGILGVFGIAHTWLGMRHHEKDKEVKRLEDVITQVQNEIRRLEVDVNHRKSNGTLCNQMEALGIRLQLMQPREAILLGSNVPAPHEAVKSN